MASGGGVITDVLFDLVEIRAPRQIVENQHQGFLFNLGRGIKAINEPFLNSKYNPIEYVYVTTKDPDNHNYIPLVRYPEIPYWNRHYSHPLIEEMSNFAWIKAGATHVYRFVGDCLMHMAAEDTAEAQTGFWLSHRTIAFTY